MRTVDFLSKVPPSAPIYRDAAAGALRFSLTLGAIRGEKMIRWSGLYAGKGGSFKGKTVAASACDNFWRFHQR